MYFLRKHVEKDWFLLVLWFESEVYRKRLDDLDKTARDNRGLGWTLHFHNRSQGRGDISDNIRLIPCYNHFLSFCNRNELKLTLICTVDLVVLKTNPQAELSLHQNSAMKHVAYQSESLPIQEKCLIQIASLFLLNRVVVNTKSFSK